MYVAHAPERKIDIKGEAVHLHIWPYEPSFSLNISILISGACATYILDSWQVQAIGALYTPHACTAYYVHMGGGVWLHRVLLFATLL